MNRLDPQDLRNRLHSTHAWSKKSLGQHFLVDGSVLDAILQAADIIPGEVVVEIGPGMGVLTERLVTAGAAVLAFEVDAQMQAIIRADFPQVTLIAGDILQEAPARINTLTSYKVVANIPYQITTPLLKLFLEGGVNILPRQMVLLVQKEVGQRLAAEPAKPGRGYLSVLAQYYAEVEYVRSVPKQAFWPTPAVESAIISLKTRARRIIEPEQERAFLHFVRMAFANPRKQLKNVLAGIRGVEAGQMATLFKTLGLPETTRAQELSLEQWRVLFTKGV